ncbi:MAG: glutathione S-transferase, partial [Porticoccaceae bacterium]|nr:glutathione S-transferase [Porticoccaceae bacterium]
MIYPVLYSFRRCPYAMRARMTLLYASITVEIREVFLGNKPQALLEVSSKETVPVLLCDGQVLDESLDIMLWALRRSDPQQWLRADLQDTTLALVAENDGSFKTALDQYKYWDRFPAESQQYYRLQGERFLSKLDQLLQANQYLLADSPTLADIAIFPFIRQFAFVDKAWFDQSSYQHLRRWLHYFIESPLFAQAMHKYPAWQPQD